MSLYISLLKSVPEKGNIISKRQHEKGTFCSSFLTTKFQMSLTRITLYNLVDKNGYQDLGMDDKYYSLSCCRSKMVDEDPILPFRRMENYYYLCTLNSNNSILFASQKRRANRSMDHPYLCMFQYSFHGSDLTTEIPIAKRFATDKKNNSYSGNFRLRICMHPTPYLAHLLVSS